MDRIGDLFVLWQVEYRSDAYTDQMGIHRPGHLISDEFVVTVREIRDDPNATHTGNPKSLIAFSEDGREFSRGTTTRNDDSLLDSYLFHWHGPVDGVTRYVDAIRSYNLRKKQPYARDNLPPGLPVHAKICPHDRAYLRDTSYDCYDCWDLARKASA